MKLLFLLVFCLVILKTIDSSAIPMWEYLTKDEKMSYLYSMFKNQVDDFCGKTSMANCNKELLKYGLGKLKDMPEDHLDTMDPYQRDANNIIWGSMMKGHEMMKPIKNDKVIPSLPDQIDKVTVLPPKNFEKLSQDGVRVYLDGRPVVGSIKPMPLDDDFRQYQLTKSKIPNI